MSILKRKIRLVPAIDELENDDDKIAVKKEEYLSDVPTFKPAICSIQISTQSKPPASKPKKASNVASRLQEKSSNLIPGTKIIRNYAKALCAFAHSDMATPYLKGIMEKNFPEKDELRSFQKHIKLKKRKAGSIDSLKELLIVNSTDTEREVIHKKLFMDVSVIFLKFFAVNWLFSGSVKHRLEHLKYRHKMLRRIQHPDLFTFLKGSLRK